MENNPSARDYTGTHFLHTYKRSHDICITCLVSNGLDGKYNVFEKSINHPDENYFSNKLD